MTVRSHTAFELLVTCGSI